MSIFVRNLFGMLAVALLLLGSAGKASAQVVVTEYTPAVTYYRSVPSVSYYGVPTVSYYTTPTVSYYSTYAAPTVSYYTTYATPAVSYYAAPAVSYYPGAVTTTRYGLFGRPRETRTYYPAYVAP